MYKSPSYQKNQQSKSYSNNHSKGYTYNKDRRKLVNIPMPKNYKPPAPTEADFQYNLDGTLCIRESDVSPDPPSQGSMENSMASKMTQMEIERDSSNDDNNSIHNKDSKNRYKSIFNNDIDESTSYDHECDVLWSDYFEDI